MAKPKKRFIVIGLGRFGSTLARQLSHNGCQVSAVDSCRESVEAIKDLLHEGVIGDATERETLEHLSMADADAVFISLGTTIIPSLLATLHARELGARRLIVKGLDEEHAKLLKHMHVERVIFPEIEVATELADRMTWPNVLDYLPINAEYSLVELTVPQSWHSRTLAELNLRHDYGISVVGVKDALSNTVTVFPDGTFVLSDDHLLLVIGKQADLERVREQK
jgi:trk system potassium uptake protein TrkA